MKKIIALLAIICLSFTFSCSKKEKIVLKGDLKDLPSWIVEPGVENGVAAVGIAGPSKGGIQFQIPKAELDAKANIASIIQSEITRVTKQSLRSAKLNGEDDVEEFFSQATKDVVKSIPLSGVKRLNMYKADDGSLYIRMVLREADYSKFLNNSQKIFDQKLKRADIARENINKTQVATKDIFDELEKERD